MSKRRGIQRIQRIAAAAALTGTGLTVALASPAGAATITVSTTSMVVAVDGQCSLPEAVQAADTNAATDTCVAGSAVEVDIITLPAGDFSLAASLNVTDAAGVHLRGAGADATSLTGDGSDRLIVNGGGALVVEALALLDGDVAGDGGAILTVDSPVTVLDALVAGNSANHGGAIRSTNGAIVVERSRFEGNRAAQDALNGNGGAINSSGGDVTITDSTFEGGFAANAGGALLAGDGDVRIAGSTFTGNEARAGGAVYNSFGLIEIANSTFDGNVTGNINDIVGGTIQSSNSDIGTIELLHVTLTDNTGFGLARGLAPTTITGSIISGNSAGDCTGFNTATSGGGNVTGDSTCGLAGAGDQPDTDPLLGPLSANGGPTATRLPLAGSPSIDAALATDCPAADQRGEARPSDGDEDGDTACDAGAVEVQGDPPVTPDPDPSPEDPATPTPGAAQPVTAPPSYTG